MTVSPATLVAVAMLAVAQPAAARTLADAGLRSACDANVFALEYERPWGTVPVQRGRAELGFPVGEHLWVGACATGLRAPTVEDTGFGLWFAAGGWMRGAVLRRDLRVAGLAATDRYDVRTDLRWASGALALGWTGELLDLGDRVAGVTVRRVWWVGVVGGDAASLTLGRRSGSWSVQPRWEVELEIRLGPRIALAGTWHHYESQVGVRFALAGSELTVNSVFSGPRTGGLGVRLRSSR